MGVATVAANRIALVVTKMITHLHVQYPLGQLAEQTVRANELDALLAGLRHQLLDHTLLINASRRRHLLLDLLGTVLVVWSDCSRKEDRVYRASYR